MHLTAEYREVEGTRFRASNSGHQVVQQTRTFDILLVAGRPYAAQRS